MPMTWMGIWTDMEGYIPGNRRVARGTDGRLFTRQPVFLDACANARHWPGSCLGILEVIIAGAPEQFPYYRQLGDERQYIEALRRCRIARASLKSFTSGIATLRQHCEQCPLLEHDAVTGLFIGDVTAEPYRPNDCRKTIVTFYFACINSIAAGMSNEDAGLLGSG